jgi:hypothetical protein
VAYWRFTDVIFSSVSAVAANSGTAGASLNGTYPAAAGLAGAGPQPPSETGFETTNSAVNLTNDFVGAPPLMLKTNTITFEAWINPQAAMANYNGILFARGSGSMLTSTYGLAYNGAGSLTYNWGGAGWDFNSGLTPPLNQWSYAAAVIYPDRSIIYMYDGYTWSSATKIVNNSVNEITVPTFIGVDPFASRFFVGAIDEPAVYGKTLTEGQLRTHALAGFGSPAAPLFVYDPPVSTPSTIYATMPFTITPDVYGLPPLIYQWRHNGTNIIGATNAIFAKTSAALTDSGNYDLIVTNPSGSITSLLVAVTIDPAVAATITQPPTSRQIYAGGRATFAVLAGGTEPYTYQWTHAGTNLPGATAATLVIDNVSATQTGNYAVAVSNMVGGTVSSPATLTIRTPTSTYETALVAAGPEAYWRFNETSGMIAADYVSSFDAANVGGVTVGQAGPQPAAKLGFETGNSAFGYSGPSQSETGVYLLNNRTNFTLCCWINTLSVKSLAALMDQEQNVRLGFFNGNLTVELFSQSITVTTPASAVTDGQWHFIACAGTPTNMSLYVDGALKNTQPVGASNGYGTGTSPFRIGGSLRGTTGNDFEGSVDEAALFNRALTGDEIGMLYNLSLYSTSTSPQIVQDPQPLILYAGRSAHFSVQAFGSPPLSYQWNANGVPIAGASTMSLVLPNVQSSLNGTRYSVTITNVAGVRNSATALLTIITPNPGYEAAAVSAGPLAYWRLDESVGSTTAYDFAGGYHGVIGADVQMGVAGPQPADGFTTLETTNTAASFVQVAAHSSIVAPPPNFSSNTLTITAWINPAPSEYDYASLLISRGAGVVALNYGGGANAGELCYQWSTMSGANSGWNWNSGVVPPSGQWSFVALVVQPTQALLYLINTNGQTVATNSGVFHPVIRFASTYLGADSYSLYRAYNGYLDEVAIYPYAMTPMQVQNLYNGISIITPPQLTIQSAGGKVVLTWDKGLLLETDDVTGPWTTNNAAVSPFTNTPSGGRKFYRAVGP